eukprot:9874584-Ditylum_brightwellii.AAC.1
MVPILARKVIFSCVGCAGYISTVVAVAFVADVVVAFWMDSVAALAHFAAVAIVSLAEADCCVCSKYAAWLVVVLESTKSATTRVVNNGKKGKKL